MINKAWEKHRDEGNKTIPFLQGVIDEKHREEGMEKHICIERRFYF